jgi:mRNA interferase MazF
VRNAVTIAPITRMIRKIPVEVPLGPPDGMPSHCVVNLDGIATIPKALVTDRITTLSEERIREVDAAIRFALDLS